MCDKVLKNKKNQDKVLFKDMTHFHTLYLSLSHTHTHTAPELHKSKLTSTQRAAMVGGVRVRACVCAYVCVWHMNRMWSIHTYKHTQTCTHTYTHSLTYTYSPTHTHSHILTR
jgi:hypothetical protein